MVSETKLTIKRSSIIDAFITPSENGIAYNNPPYFQWPHQPDTNIKFTLLDENKNELYNCHMGKNLLQLPFKLKKKIYYWQLKKKNKIILNQKFTMASKDQQFAPLSYHEFSQKLNLTFPKYLWGNLPQADIQKIKKKILPQLKNHLTVALKDGMPSYPTYHTQLPAKEARHQMTIYFKRFRQYCDRNLMSMCFLYFLTKESSTIDYIKNFVHTITSWNPEGVCAVDGPWGDEIGLSLARNLPIAYDLTYTIWNKQERIWIEKTLIQYGRQVFRRLNDTDFFQQPGNSHVGRLPCYLGDFAVILKGILPDEETDKWLKTSFDIFNTFYPFWGKEDGGWAQGPFYASTYLKWHLPFFAMVQSKMKRSFWQRSFYQNYLHYIIHMINPSRETHPFGDGFWTNEIEKEWPGFFAYHPETCYQELYGNKTTDKLLKKTKQALFELHILDEMIPHSLLKKQKKTVMVTHDHIFDQTGFISLNSNINQPKHNNSLIARCSPYTSGSHQHADQGNFAIYINGKSMVQPSGYFGKHYGDKHHQEWTQKTKAHNLFLINNEGQLEKNPQAIGVIEKSELNKNYSIIKMNLTKAYSQAVSVKRTILFIKPANIFIFDSISLKKSGCINWLLHSLKKPLIKRETMRIVNHSEYIKMNFIMPEKALSYHLTNQFDLASPYLKRNHEKRRQYHMSWEFSSKKNHHIWSHFQLDDKELPYEIKKNQIKIKGISNWINFL